MSDRRILFIVLILLFLVGCNRSKHTVLQVSWQHAKSEVCLGCRRPGLDESQIQSAVSALNKKLAAKGIKVEGVEKTPSEKLPTGANTIWIGGIPLDQWLGGQVTERACCGHGGMARTLQVDGRSYDIIPAELVVRAGLSAADMLLENGKIDPTKLKVKGGCGGCPSAGSCPKARMQ